MRVIIVGAGLAGLAASIDLVAAGHDVTILDKGRSPGGRMATRRIGEARLDHGAQFFTVRSDAFASFVEPHLASGLVYEWCRGFSASGDGFARYAVRGGMNALPKVMATGLDVRCDTLVFAVRPTSATGSRSWSVALDDGSAVEADVVVITAPLPQAYSLLVSAGIELADTMMRTDYDRTIALLATLDSAPAIAEPGGLQQPTSTLSFVADNHRKGVSPVPAVTVHANADWSEAHWDDPSESLLDALLDEAAAFVGTASVTSTQVKKWRFATPRTISPQPFWASADGTVVLAGDAFAGPKVEGAVLSGIAAAHFITHR